ncbi:hypothetical protein EZS27_016184 [termite gut metagenome]|uniref:Uncharacterized protein n=1 Tax=termite gut metagenome TaxID=433724 RepID=A0A5J4RPP9_9ZZZZ
MLYFCSFYSLHRKALYRILKNNPVPFSLVLYESFLQFHQSKYGLGIIANILLNPKCTHEIDIFKFLSCT